MKDEYFQVKEGSLCFQIRRGREKTLVFLHGGGGSISSWDIIKPMLEKTPYTLIFLDLRGHGKSFRPSRWQDYMLETHAQDILKFFDKNDIDKPILIGHCLGAMIAATFAATFPSHLQKLILINPGLKKRTLLFNSVFYPFIVFLYNILLILPKRTYVKKTRVDYRPFRGSSDLAIPRLLKDVVCMGFFSAVAQTYAFYQWQDYKVYSQIQVPTLILGSKYDIIFSYKQATEISKLIKNSQLKIIESNHIAPINNPEEIINFLI